ncbi:glycosyltransferase [Georgenia sp. Z1491]|uniref:glycosyltransferase n=1 Tax=Georgenia sp. Z1491 TaxID=3416707 RepID=UPI003CEAF8E3
MTPPTVSVVIPARNDAAALEHCLRALANQREAPLEVIVVDNASTDGTAAVARRHGAVVVAEDRIGIPPAAATGYDAARGDVVARLDADSRPGPGWVSRVAHVMGTRQVAAVTGVGSFYGLGRAGGLAAAVYLAAYYGLCHAALGHHPLWGSSMAVRRSAWLAVRDRVHDDDPEVHDDLDLALALGPARPVVLDLSLRVGVSARSLVGAAQLSRRLRRAFRTLRLGWADMPPWERWSMRFGLPGAAPAADDDPGRAPGRDDGGRRGSLAP